MTKHEIIHSGYIPADFGKPDPRPELPNRWIKKHKDGECDQCGFYGEIYEINADSHYHSARICKECFEKMKRFIDGHWDFS